jgi:hypothetical protein
MKTKHAVWFVVVVLMLSVPPLTDAGFFKKIGKAFKSAVSFPGRVQGWAAGGFVDSATTPMINQFEDAGKSLIRETNGMLDRQIEHLNSVAKERLDQMDGILKVRITQVDESFKQRIEQVDKVMETRILQIDSVMEKRILQVDDMMERRIGNLDVVATKASLTFEESVVRILAVGCCLIFLAIAIWLVYGEWMKIWPSSAGNLFSRMKQVLIQTYPAVSGRIAFAGVALLVLWTASRFLPGGPRSKKAELAESHIAAMEQGLAHLDFKKVAYHASQLHALDSIDARISGKRQKAELIRDLLSRPTLLQSEQGVETVLDRLAALDSALGKDKDPDVLAAKGLLLWRIGSNKFIEHLAAECFAKALTTAPESGFAMQWLASAYLDAYLQRPISKWILSGIHVEVEKQIQEVQAETVTALNLDIPHRDLLKLQSALAGFRDRHVKRSGDPSQVTFAGALLENGLVARSYAPYVEYNDNVLALWKQSDDALYTMLDTAVRIPSQIEPAKKDEMLRKVKQEAQRVTEVWNTFDNSVRNHLITLTPEISLAPLMLNDSAQARAHFYTLATTFETTPQADGLVPDPSGNVPVQVMRVKMGPVLANYYKDENGAALNNLRNAVNWQETRRYYAFEKRLIDFELDYARYIRATASSKPASALQASKTAADIILYRPRVGQELPVPLADDIINRVFADPSVLKANGLYGDQFKEVLVLLLSRQPGLL